MRLVSLPKLDPALLSLLLATVVTLAGNATDAPRFWLGVMVMVTGLIFQITLSLVEDRESSPRLCREPHASVNFLIATGAFIASGSTRLPMLAFVVMLFYFQVWRILNETSSDASIQDQPVFLPDPGSFRDIALEISQEVRDALRGHRKITLPVTGSGLMRWLLPSILIVMLIARKGVSS